MIINNGNDIKKIVKKFTLAIALLVICCLALFAWIGWQRRTAIASKMLEKHLGVPVKMQRLDVNSQGARIDHLTIKNPKGFRSPSSFAADTIAIDTTWKKLRGDPLTIDLIQMDNILVTIEESSSGKTNWDLIVGDQTPNSAPTRHWLIKTLVLNNLTVQVMQPNGTIKKYPTLSQMQFYNLTDKTGFPVDQIEKAILNEVMKNLLRNFNLQNLLHPVMPGGMPLPSFPSLF